MPSLLDEHPDFARFLDGVAAAGATLRIPRSALEAFCGEQELWGLLHHRLSSSDGHDWPPDWRASLRRHAHAEAATELLRAGEIKSVLHELAAAGITPILFKGTALAYSIYPSPGCRPRNDTDIVIAADQVESARRVLIACGYAATVYCAEIFSQFEMQRVDRFGVLHVFDVHWRVSTQPVFEKLPTYDGLVSRCQALPPLGPHARAAGRVDALLIACVHPAMHHRNLERALWIYDVHLLASAISEAELAEFVLRAEAAEVGPVAAHALQRARAVFGTAVPDWVLARLAAAVAESSSAYLASERRWHDELLSSVRALPTLGRRMALVRAVLFPSPQYVLGAYGFGGKRLGPWLLPALYAHRNLRGAWRVLTRKK
jgi:hypothetical protein